MRFNLVVLVSLSYLVIASASLGDDIEEVNEDGVEEAGLADMEMDFSENGLADTADNGVNLELDDQQDLGKSRKCGHSNQPCCLGIKCFGKCSKVPGMKSRCMKSGSRLICS